MAFDPFHYFVKRQEDIERLVGGSKATFEALGIRTRDQLTESVLGIDSETLKRLTDPLGEQRLLESTRATFLANNAIESALASEVKALADISRYFTVDRLQINAALSGVPASATEIAAAVNSMAALTEAARIAAAGIGFDRFGVAAYARQEQERLARFTGRLAGTHAALMESLSGSMVFPAFVSRLPTADLFAHTTTVRIISPGRPRSDQEKRQTRELRTRVTKEAEAFLVEELPRIKPAFLQQYRGAKSVAIARGPDWWTHGGASLRKLLKGVLHTVAPTEVVLEWAARHHKLLDQNGRPTRATKIDWLCEHIKNDARRAYVRLELMGALDLIGRLDAANHVGEFEEFEQQYDSTFTRVEIVICHIVEIWKSREDD